MKKFFTILITVIITTIVVLLLLAVLILGYLFVKNPFGMGDLVKTQILNQPAEEIVVDENFDHPLLTADQEQKLIEAGIDPAKLPTEITPEMEACVSAKVSEERIQEIINGAEPTPFEIVKVLPCL